MSNLALPTGEFIRNSGSSSAPDMQAAVYSASDMASDYVFFNHGALFTYAGFVEGKQDPVQDWYGSQSHTFPVLRQAYRQPIFRGLDARLADINATWNQVLFGVPKEHWPSLAEYLCGIVIHDHGRRMLAMAYMAPPEAVTIYDPAYVDQKGLVHPALPTIQCAVFCVSSNHARWELVRPLPLTRAPEIVQLPPTSEMLEFYQLAQVQDMDFLSQRLNPAHYAFHEQYRKAMATGAQLDAQSRKIYLGE